MMGLKKGVTEHIFCIDLHTLMRYLVGYEQKKCDRWALSKKVDSTFLGGSSVFRFSCPIFSPSRRICEPETNIPLFSPRRRLYPPACKLNGLEAAPEAIIPYCSIKK
jgi:hypothetical protein